MKLRKPSATAPRVRPVERRESISSAIAERFAEWALANQTHDYIPRMTRQNLDIMYEQRVEQLVESPLSDPDALDNLKLTLRVCPPNLTDAPADLLKFFPTLNSFRR